MKPLPRVLVNFAMTADGKISTREATPSSFTSKADKRRLLEIRAMGDAILVGRNTVAADAMSMGISAPDLREERAEAGKSQVPLRVIVSESGRFDPKWKVFSNSDSPLILCTSTEIPKRLSRQFPAFVEILKFPAGRIAMRSLLELLRSRWGVKLIVCEGGPGLLRSLLEANLVDELYLTIAPHIFGGRGAISLSGLPGGFLPREYCFRLKSLEQREGEAFLHYLRDQRKAVAMQ